MIHLKIGYPSFKIGRSSVQHQVFFNHPVYNTNIIIFRRKLDSRRKDHCVIRRHVHAPNSDALSLGSDARKGYSNHLSDSCSTATLELGLVRICFLLC